MIVSLSATHQLPIDPFPRVQAVCQFTLPQARRWLDDLVGDEKSLLLGNKLTLESGIVIECPQLMRVLETEEQADIDDRYYRQNRQFRRGPWHEQPKADPIPKSEPKAIKPERPKKPEGLISVAQIAVELKVKPFDVRQALRNSGAIKPDYGWLFSPDEVKAVKKLVGGK